MMTDKIVFVSLAWLCPGGSGVRDGDISRDSDGDISEDPDSGISEAPESDITGSEDPDGDISVDSDGDFDVDSDSDTGLDSAADVDAIIDMVCDADEELGPGLGTEELSDTT